MSSVTLKISPVFKEYFNELEYKVAVESYYDIEFYLRSMHPKFGNYIRQLQLGLAQENFAYVDKNLKLVQRQEYPIKKIYEGDVIHIAPVVCGGGGKKGFIFAAIAVVAISFMIPNPMALSGSFIGPPTAAQSASSLGGSVFASMTSGFAGLPSMVKGMLGNLALSVIGSLFTSKPKGKPIQQTKDSGTRTENNMFGSLANTTTSGTPVAMNYGLMRIGGQFLSGYILSTQHDQGNSPTIQSIFDASESPIANSIGSDD